MSVPPWTKPRQPWTPVRKSWEADPWTPAYEGVLEAALRRQVDQATSTDSAASSAASSRARGGVSVAPAPKWGSGAAASTGAAKPHRWEREVTGVNPDSSVVVMGQDPRTFSKTKKNFCRRSGRPDGPLWNIPTAEFCETHPEWQAVPFEQRRHRRFLSKIKAGVKKLVPTQPKHPPPPPPPKASGSSSEGTRPRMQLPRPPRPPRKASPRPLRRPPPLQATTRPPKRPLLPTTEAPSRPPRDFHEDLDDPESTWQVGLSSTKDLNAAVAEEVADSEINVAADVAEAWEKRRQVPSGKTEEEVGTWRWSPKDSFHSACQAFKTFKKAEASASSTGKDDHEDVTYQIVKTQMEHLASEDAHQRVREKGARDRNHLNPGAQLI